MKIFLVGKSGKLRILIFVFKQNIFLILRGNYSHHFLNFPDAIILVQTWRK